MSDKTQKVDVLDIMDEMNDSLDLEGIGPSADKCNDAREVVANLIYAGRRTIEAFEELGRATGAAEVLVSRTKCEREIILLKESLERIK